MLNKMKKTVKKTKKESLVNLKKKAIENKEVKALTKEKEFKLFEIWLSLPTVLMGKPEAYLQEIGIRDEDALKLMKVKNRTEFSKEYKVSPQTLANWSRRVNMEEVKKRSMDWFKGLTKNVISALYHKTLEHGDAARARLWMELFEGKEPEGGNPRTGAPQFNQIIINLGKKYEQDLRTEYEKQIKNLPSD